MLRHGALVVNADDWGLDRDTTSRIFDCFRKRTISSASGMVFMVDSRRAADLARQHSFDIGLHLNLTTPFSDPKAPARLIEQQQRVAGFLLKRRVAPAIYHPGLASSFEYLVLSQLEEFSRIYGCMPDHIDGHHHMHLCANVIFGNLLPVGVAVRRNFTFFPGEKSCWNRLYRKIQDAYVSRRHPIPDYLFELSSAIRSARLAKICALALHAVVEIEAHPGRPGEYNLLMNTEPCSELWKMPIASQFLASVPQ